MLNDSSPILRDGVDDRCSHCCPPHHHRRSSRRVSTYFIIEQSPWRPQIAAPDATYKGRCSLAPILFLKFFLTTTLTTKKEKGTKLLLASVTKTRREENASAVAPLWRCDNGTDTGSTRGGGGRGGGDGGRGGEVQLDAGCTGRCLRKQACTRTRKAAQSIAVALNIFSIILTLRYCGSKLIFVT